jgi:hypothetical protein
VSDGDPSLPVQMEHQGVDPWKSALGAGPCGEGFRCWSDVLPPGFGENPAEQRLTRLDSSHGISTATSSGRSTASREDQNVPFERVTREP